MFTNLKFCKNTVLFSCRKKEYLSLMHVCYKKLAPWPSSYKESIERPKLFHDLCLNNFDR